MRICCRMTARHDAVFSERAENETLVNTALPCYNIQWKKEERGTVSKKRVSIQLDGRSYVVITEDDEEYVRDIAEEVSQSLLKASCSAKNLDVRDCAILVALDYCDDCQKERRRNKDLVEKADQIVRHTNELNRKCTDYKEKLTDAMNENTRLSKRIRALEEQLRVLNKENERLKKFEPKKTDAEKLFEKTVQEKHAERLMGYVPMEQGSLFDDEFLQPEKHSQLSGKKKKKHGKH